MKLKLHQYDLPLKYKFGISRETRTVQKTVIVELIDNDIHGFGECVANHKYYKSTIEDIFEDLKKLETKLENIDLRIQKPQDVWKEFSEELNHNPFAQNALDMAMYDLWGKIHKKPTYELLNFNIKNNIVTDYTIGIDEIDIMVKKMEEFSDWPIFKIKLGTEHDIEIMTELRKHTDATLRIDANCAWNAEQTIEYSKELKKLGVEFIEQPLPADDWSGMKKVYEKSELPVIADESVIKEGDVERCFKYFHGVNIKVVKCGGLTPAMRMIRKARTLNMKVMVGCMTESTVGISGIAQLLPLLDYVDMDGPLLLAKDIATGVRIEKGKVCYSDVSGNGVELLDEN
ncbi:MAG: dipeptide epimerase [Candidatus Marinimicrobia bacterium]|nr:dipeptide epimerase [Candidatus Neomarinimicrobiota bacterium]